MNIYSGTKKVHVHPGWIRPWQLHLIRKICFKPDNFSSHSFRRGGTSYAFKAGVPADLIQLHEDWRSDAYMKYLVLTLHNKIRVAETTKKCILTGKC